MVRAAGAANKEHARQALDTIVDLLEATDDESVQIDGSIPPGFGEWRLKGVKMAWFAEMAPTDRQDTVVWPVLWRTNIPSITHEFMYRVLWKKLQVRQRVGLVKDTQDGCVWCECSRAVSREGHNGNSGTPRGAGEALQGPEKGKSPETQAGEAAHPIGGWRRSLVGGSVLCNSADK